MLVARTYSFPVSFMAKVMQVYTWWNFVYVVQCVPFIVESLSINYVTPSISRVWSLSWACSYIVGGECHCSLLTYIYAGCVFSTLLLSISTDSTFSTPLIGIETSSYVLVIILCDWSCSSYEGIMSIPNPLGSFAPRVQHSIHVSSSPSSAREKPVVWPTLSVTGTAPSQGQTSSIEKSTVYVPPTHTKDNPPSSSGHPLGTETSN